MRIDGGIRIAFPPDQVEELTARDQKARSADRPARTHPAAERTRIVLRARNQLEAVPGWIFLGSRDGVDPGNGPRRILAEADLPRLDRTWTIHQAIRQPLRRAQSAVINHHVGTPRRSGGYRFALAAIRNQRPKELG